MSAPLRAESPGADPRADRSPGPVGFADAMSLARRAVALYTELRVDAVANCEMIDGVWRVSVDVVEAPARMGDNDLIAAYDVTLSPEGDVTKFTRTGRYHRNDAARAGR